MSNEFQSVVITLCNKRIGCAAFEEILEGATIQYETVTFYEPYDNYFGCESYAAVHIDPWNGVMMIFEKAEDVEPVCIMGIQGIIYPRKPLPGKSVIPETLIPSDKKAFEGLKSK